MAVIAARWWNCAVLENGHVKCWGYNSNGQLGLGDIQWRGYLPTQMGDNLPEVSLW
jgi:alpha-tubulin suppressor-like RCC1 family protein